MKVKELIELLQQQQVNPEAFVVVEDVYPPSRTEFLGDYGFCPRVKCHQHDDGPIVILAAAKSLEEPLIIHKDDRRCARRLGPYLGSG